MTADGRLVSDASRQKSCVVVSRAPKFDYQRDYVALPANFGTEQYYKRQDIQNIVRVVEENLELLDAKTGFINQLKGRRVLIKPNLVTVYHNAGFVDSDYPNTTDPRVIDAVLGYLKQYAKELVLVESSGRGMPTRGAFRIAGLDRLAKKHGTELIALEEQPVDYYYLPKAKVMKHILVPRIFAPVLSGEAYYISMPKLKTNLYTQVTLGFKNSMGCIPYNLRQQNHNYDLDQKLVDMLYVFRPDLVIIDGIVGAQGQCPAPVEPVDSRVIISGTNSVETDRVATRIMGFDPQAIKLMQLAAESGFGDFETEVIGELPALAFKPADPSLFGAGFHALFPNVKALIGHALPHSPRIAAVGNLDAQTLTSLEKSCRGGCLATTRLGFEFLRYEGLETDFQLVVIIGGGVEIGGKRWYFDRDGKAYNTEQINSLPGKKLAVGSCAIAGSGQAADCQIKGCMVFPNSVHMKLHRLTRTRCRVVSPTAPSVAVLLRSTWQMRRRRMALLRRGEQLDFSLNFQPSQAREDAKGQDFIKLPLPDISLRERRRLIRAEWQEIFDLLIY